MNEPPLEERETTFESACAPYCEPTTDERETTYESACAPYCEPSADERETNYLTRPATENENPNETSEDVNENPTRRPRT
ncbi:hypothetical protein PR001_g31697 [Phytophthora rubi]|uniref:Uncharacterized protein n=1 Tax=Phytophthora rubi TaxID=129364 RepID=A0A6A3GJP3_9STRA|nr:hypothetical protein PR001_g31697 [Phytophthora rubi]KAE8957261.1 hypothetical protein PR002_g31222 [Phytophthora rubi]